MPGPPLPPQLPLQTCTAPRPCTPRAARARTPPRGSPPRAHGARARGRCGAAGTGAGRLAGHSPTPGTPAWPRSPARSSAARGARTRAGGAAAPGPRGSPRSWRAGGRPGGGGKAKLRPLQSPCRDGRLYGPGRGWGGGTGGVARWTGGARGWGGPAEETPRGMGLRPGTCAPGPAAPASHGPGWRGGGSGSHRGDLDINQMLCIHVTPTLYPSPNLRKKETQPWGSVLRAS